MSFSGERNVKLYRVEPEGDPPLGKLLNAEEHPATLWYLDKLWRLEERFYTHDSSDPNKVQVVEVFRRVP